MRADQQGEGGILVLTSLIREPKRRKRLVGAAILVGLFGTALLYGDGMITPAISVLSAVEGLEVTVPSMGPYVLFITAAILVGLFAAQRQGTERVGRVFGPIMVIWFTTLGILGIVEIAGHPSVLRAVDPSRAIGFFVDHGFGALLVLGSVFLVVTGGEALYADMGHFGKRPIRLAWFTLVLPGLVLNYFGQGALVISDHSAVESPFYLLAPSAMRIPLLFLATAATVIASQALISGAFSLAMQSVQLGYLPRLRIEHTSPRQRGQVYVPAVNWILMVASITLVFAFRSSGGLAAAYGVAVTMTMLITTVLFAMVARRRWHWPLWTLALLIPPLLAVDIGFLSANILKIPDGGWVPLVVGFSVLAIMTTWHTGKRIINRRLREGDIPLEPFVEELATGRVGRVPGTAVYLYAKPFAVPPMLVTNIRYHGVLHERVILLAVQIEDRPRVHPRKRLEIHHLDAGITQVIVHAGFMERPSIPAALEVDAMELGFHPLEAYYFLGLETVLVTDAPGMVRWREHLYTYLARNSRSAATHFGIPPDRVVEVGVQVEL
jgi:KUP system potassium uptake protein